MTDADDVGGVTCPRTHRWVVSREPPWWVVMFYAPGLPAEGVRHLFRTHAEAWEGWFHLYREEYTGAGVVGEYDFGEETDAKLGTYHMAFLKNLAAPHGYAEAGAAITSALADQHQASLRDIAAILHQSYWRVSRMEAWRPIVSLRVLRYLRWVRPPRVQRWAGRSVYAADILGRQARIIAADSVRVARTGSRSEVWPLATKRGCGGLRHPSQVQDWRGANARTCRKILPGTNDVTCSRDPGDIWGDKRSSRDAATSSITLVTCGYEWS